MPWIFEMGRYKMACQLRDERFGERATITVVENGQELDRQDFSRVRGENGIEFNRRVWKHVWALQDRFRQRAHEGLRREWKRQASEG